MLAVYLTEYLVLFAVHVEVSHALAAQSVLQSLGQVACAYAHYVRLVAVDVYARFGLAELQVDVRHLEHRILVYLLHELGKHFLELFEVGGLQYILYWHARTTPSER